jgi:hypothetical protein
MKFDLEKDTAKVRFILEKKNIPSLTAEVVADLDVSGSTKSIYASGAMQEAIQRVVPVALNFDDNGELPVYIFNDSDQFAQLSENLTSGNYSNYIQQQILMNQRLPRWGGTDYAPVLRQNLIDLGFLRSDSPPPSAHHSGFWSSLFGAEQSRPTPRLRKESHSGIPAIVYFFTDGENEDREETANLLEACSSVGSQVYFNFIGVGNERFDFLNAIGDRFPNTGFAQIRDIERTAGSDEIYEYLVPDELTRWLATFVRK